MRPLLIVPVLLLLLAPAVTAGTGGGNGVGAQAGDYSAGMWDIWRVYVTTPGTLSASLSWVASPGGSDYDLTLWAPGADQDNLLAQSEMLKASWTRSATNRQESLSHAVAPNAKAYVVTVEAVSAKLETYTLTVTGGQLVRVCHNASPPFTCLWAAQGVKDLS